jgi:hypothetical protein
MFVVWNRMGFLTPLIAFGCILLANTIMPTLDARIGIAFAIAAIANWFVGKHFNKGEVRTFRDENSGEVFEVSQTHTFFWIGMEWWSIGFALFALYAFYQIM